ncbi:hypothetical protein WN72_28600 [Bradyrhizobium arachidis]|uniref:Uncharacterized protein n=1 Tax=Bradyrhizobium arachidis TaxID=858423 RepID=A0AAE7TIE4_9BRAD|nr:hypothetical protein WN72_28600 [Bradyrhizobium arachidis]
MRRAQSGSLLKPPAIVLREDWSHKAAEAFSRILSRHAAVVSEVVISHLIEVGLGSQAGFLAPSTCSPLAAGKPTFRRLRGKAAKGQKATLDAS